MNNSTKNLWLSTKGVGALGLIAAASYFLLVEHRDHRVLSLQMGEKRRADAASQRRLHNRTTCGRRRSW